MEDHQRFHFRDGNSAGSLDELRDYLEHISYQEFYHHVNTEKNDFANWILHVIKNEELANDLEKITSIVETVEIINDFLHPRATEASHDDLQSKIEEESLELHMPVEEVPTTAPTAEVTEETIDLDVIHERVEADEQEEQAEPQAELHTDDHVLTKSEYSKLIVKDFMYGLLFGLILGVILGRILSF